MHQTNFKIEDIIRLLPLLPVFGFLFALSYELSFFWFLDIELQQILTLTDIIESSALNILPTIPLLLIGYLLNSDNQLDDHDLTEQTKFKKIYNNLPYIGIRVILIFAAIMYIFFGSVPSFGFMSTLLLTLFIVTYVFFIPILIKIDPNYFRIVWMCLAVTVISASRGYAEANSIRLGNHLELPLVKKQLELPIVLGKDMRLIRRLSSGILVSGKKKGYLFFISNDNSTVFTFNIDVTPFRGILCGGYGWCPAIIKNIPTIDENSK